jgi:hypothetical protein
MAERKRKEKEGKKEHLLVHTSPRKERGWRLDDVRSGITKTPAATLRKGKEKP